MKLFQARSRAAHLDRTLLSGASACALAAASVALISAPAMAADAASDSSASTVQEVVVVGIRGSVASSIAAKRTSDSIIEAVTAEDIGKLPDVSIAESLARLPGVAAQRVDGRAQVLSIRGMAPKFGVTLLNGHEMVSTGDDRSFEYDQFPSELVASAEIYKTPDAALGTQGLAGTVNLHTLRPLSVSGRKISLNARGEASSYGNQVPGVSGDGARLSGSFIDQFANGTIGVALGYAHLDSPIQKRYFNPWDYGTGNDLGVNGVTTQLTYSGFETGVASTSTVRDGFLGVLEYKPNANFHSQLDLFHSQFRQRMAGRELIGVLANWANGYTPSVVPAANGTPGGAVTNATPIITQRKDNRNDDVDAVDWSNALALGAWTAHADISYSKAHRTEQTGEAYATPYAPVDFTTTIPSTYDNFGSIKSSFDFGNAANFALSSAWWGGGAYRSVADVKDEMKSFRLSANRSLNWGVFTGVDLGVIYSERTKDVQVVGTNYNVANGSDCIVGTCLAIPSSILQSPVDLGFASVPRLISFDVDKAIASDAYSTSPNDRKSPSWNWGVSEKITTAFVKVNLEYKTIIPIHGNVGVQFINTDQHSTGLYDDNNGNLTKIGDGANYTDVLPSLNLIGDFGNKTFLRFGAAKVMARPSLSEMRGGITASVDQSTRMWSGGGGNPKLEPWRATSLDLSLEKYYNKGTYVAVAVFHKDITSGIVVQDVQYDFSKFTNPTAIVPISNMGTMSTPVNSSHGRVNGLEISGAVDASIISPMLDGFGAEGSYSHTISNMRGTDAFGNPTNTPLDGLSGDVVSLTGYYEKHGFQFRIAERYRSSFSAVRHNAFKVVTDSIRPEAITDMQVGYTFETGKLAGLGILFQINNLFDTPYVVTQTVNGSTAAKEHHEFGQQYLLGLNYKF
jgi:iron complex outermembrane receptor protein